MEQPNPLTRDAPPSLPPTSRTRAPSIREVRSLANWALVSALIYSFMVTGSKASCAGSIGAGDGVPDALGRATDTEPMCTLLELGPNPIVYLVLALLVLRATRLTAHTVTRMRNLRWACLATGVGCALVAQASFIPLDLDRIDSTPTIPFATVTVRVTPAGQ
ncbi:MAG: hypothetical protein ACTJGR_05220 [Pauljensenia sp.]